MATQILVQAGVPDTLYLFQVLFSVFLRQIEYCW